MYRILFDRCIYLLPLRASNRARIIVIAFDSSNQIDKCFLIRQTDSYAMPNANKMISSYLLFIFFFYCWWHYYYYYYSRCHSFLSIFVILGIFMHASEHCMMHNHLLLLAWWWIDWNFWPLTTFFSHVEHKRNAWYANAIQWETFKWHFRKTNILVLLFESLKINEISRRRCLVFRRFFFVRYEENEPVFAGLTTPASSEYYGGK